MNVIDKLIETKEAIEYEISWRKKHGQFISLDWFLVLEKIESLIEMVMNIDI